MKTFNVISLSCFLLLLSSPAFSQINLEGFSIGAHGSYIMVGGDTKINNAGGGVKLSYAVEEGMVAYLGYNHYLPSYHDTYIYGYRSNTEISPMHIEIDAVEQISLQQWVLGAKYYLLGDYEARGSLYGLAEMGYMRAPTQTRFSSYDQENYRPRQDDGFKTVYTTYNVNIGMGGEVDLLVGFLFAEAKLNLPANRAGNRTMVSEIPAALSFNAGMRFPLYFF
ncbi:hypothetical protein SAMN04488057_103247 [Cyclobacterium lianum]|uniref:Outer membrane protein beta-barrel domain-containing protein n=1 Tax=Cyclobacterium lianum TaxID=388280 RepID=A0A1M7LEB6_9BACT|nr:hypothetical protein [Cyclobacterium lianum]SHM76403.1 hypothetical protein SAMN04488057_103247 [Cyclobacterium lianum]